METKDFGHWPAGLVECNVLVALFQNLCHAIFENTVSLVSRLVGYIFYKPGLKNTSLWLAG